MRGVRRKSLEQTLPPQSRVSLWTGDELGEWLARVAAGRGVQVPSGPAQGTVTVREDSGRQVLDCPDCRSAGLLVEGQTTFVCGGCFNVDNDSRPWHVEII
jgi:hypothetical protein